MENSSIGIHPRSTSHWVEAARSSLTFIPTHTHTHAHTHTHSPSGSLNDNIPISEKEEEVTADTEHSDSRVLVLSDVQLPWLSGEMSDNYHMSLPRIALQFSAMQ